MTGKSKEKCLSPRLTEILVSKKRPVNLDVHDISMTSDWTNVMFSIIVGN